MHDGEVQLHVDVQLLLRRLVDQVEDLGQVARHLVDLLQALEGHDAAVGFDQSLLHVDGAGKHLQDEVLEYEVCNGV